jgi:CIC family chloride channel protein
MVAGAAAGVAAIFKAPATGAIFALEVPYRDDLGRKLLLPALIGAASGYLAFVAVDGTDRLFPVTGNPAFNLADLGGAVAVGLAAGLLARGFASAMSRAKRMAVEHSLWRRVVLGGGLLAVCALLADALTSQPLTFGPGYEAIAWARDTDHTVLAVVAVLVLRCTATTATLGAGGVGGVFIPLVVAGALLGRIAGGTFSSPHTDLFMVVGIASLLGAGYRVPLAAVMFVAETTGRPGFVVPGLLAAVAAELVMGRVSVTPYQQAPGNDLTAPPPQ